MPAATNADTVYFVSKQYGGLYRFDSANPGAGISEIKGDDTFYKPAALAMGPDGNLYVGDATDGGRIARYSLADGSISTVASLYGYSPAYSGGPVSPGSIAFTPSGSMLVGRNPEVSFYPGSNAAWPGGPVLEVTGWGVGQTAAISTFTSGTSQTYQPGLAVASDGTLYASNSFYDATVGSPTFQVMTGNVLRFGASGTFSAEVAADKAFTGGLFGPSGLALSGNALYVASTMNGIIYKTNLLDSNTATNTIAYAYTPQDPSSGYRDYIGPLAALSNGGLLTAGVAGSGLIYEFDSSGWLIGMIGNSSYGQLGGVVAVTPVPEPSAIVLGLAGLSAAGIALLRTKRR
ncbi:MAG: PEP-CTERM sorting domain-containing protein [Planctomycetia bacterium]|nr:PEP-CTERM sorting domain-containing protein [Planctomycetia bacterium]